MRFKFLDGALLEVRIKLLVCKISLIGLVPEKLNLKALLLRAAAGRPH